MDNRERERGRICWPEMVYAREGNVRSSEHKPTINILTIKDLFVNLCEDMAHCCTHLILTPMNRKHH